MTKNLTLIGMAGSGKSTILQLIMRLYDIDAGKLTVDGVELSEIDLKKWREEIAYVPQDVFLFSDTIESNVAFSVDGDAAYEVEKATKLAAVHEDVGNLQEGYKTLLGERGVNLSGGQKQRLSIARAWITGADIIFFDDSLSAVDTDTEEQILNAIGREGEEKTVVVVSHRAGIAKFADKIYCLDEGRVIEEGTPDELIDGGGYFAEIYAKQQKDNSQ